ncbi:hypothetical protein HZA38_03580 [Candidatus Peregrinibacteria bacterium]|nr:hypothetical protein [Candidatus Peregrinibacteria bacterium]
MLCARKLFSSFILSLTLALLFWCRGVSLASADELEPVPPENPGETGEEPDLLPLLLNEIDLEAEFLEIWNPNEEAVDISHMQFSEISGANEVRHNFSDFTAETNLAAQGFLVLHMSRKLNNTGEVIKLFENAETEVFFESREIPKSESGKSYSRNDTGEFSWEIPTPGEPNQKEDPEEDPGAGDPPGEEPPEEEISEEDLQNILLNEVDIFSEFIEIWNSGAKELSLKNLQFSERSGTKEVRRNFSDFSETVLIPPDGFLLLTMSGKLNNTGETIALYRNAVIETSFQSFEIPKMKEGESFARDKNGNFSITDTPTPNAKNILHLPGIQGSSGSSSSSSKKSSAWHGLLKQESVSDSVPAREIVLQISEVDFQNPHGDMIEIYCAECQTNLDLKGFHVFDDKSFFEFPPETFVKTGDYIVLSLKQEEQKIEKTEYGWHFFLTHPGLTGTDETLILFDSYGDIEDALCFSNHTIDFSPGEKEDVTYMGNRLEWISNNASDQQCFPETLLEKSMSLARKNGVDTNTQSDFFPTEVQTFGAPNPTSPISAAQTNFQIDSILFLPHETLRINIRNAGNENASLLGFTLKNSEQKLRTFSEVLLEPKEEYSFFMTDISSENIFLSLDDAWGETEDFLCFGVSNEMEHYSFLREKEMNSEWVTWEAPMCVPKNVSSEMTLLQRKNEIDTNFAKDFLLSEIQTISSVETEELFLSQILPNPEGKDDGFEWFEITARRDIPDISKWIVLVGSDILPFPAIGMREGETFRISAENTPLKTLRNENGAIFIISPNGSFQKAEWENAKENDILRLHDNAFQWESERIHQEEKNLKGTLHEISFPRKDSDHDGIPDATEASFGGDPEVFEERTSEVRKKYDAHVMANFHLDQSIEQNTIIFSGAAEPKSHVRLEIAGQNEFVSGESDDSGKFSISYSSPIPEGKYLVHALLRTPEEIKIFQKDVAVLSLDEGLRQDEITSAQIVSVLPNPLGKDSGNEQIVLKNTSEVSGFLRNWKVSNGKITKEIPETFFEKGEEKLFTGKDIPTFKNSEGKVLLIDFHGEERAQISWEKARDGEIFSASGAEYIRVKQVKKKTLKTTSPSTKNGEKSVSSSPILVSGKISDFSEQEISLILEDGSIHTYAFDVKNPQHEFFLEQILRKGDDMSVSLSPQNTILSFDVLSKKEPPLQVLEGTVPNEFSSDFTWQISLGLFSLATLTILFRKRKQIAVIRNPKEQS